MSISVDFEIGVPDPDVNPKTFRESVDALRPLMAGSVNVSGSTFIFGSEVPGVDDQDKLWFRKNSIGNLVGAYVFRLGVWAPSEPPVSARFGIFTGDPIEFFDANGKGLKGAGPIALDYWGWHLMNGVAGNQNWSNRFLIGGAMDNDGILGFDEGWRTNVNGAAEGEGGVAEITLDVDNAYTGIELGLHDATGSAGGGGPLYGTGTGMTIGETEPEPISVVNPFRAVAFIGFIGYTD